VSRLEGALAALILVAATALVTEWIHYRLGDPTLWTILRPEAASPGALSEEDDGPDSITESEFQKYVDVLERMQADRALSIEDAAKSESLSLEQFRDIEQRVQRDGAFVQRARDLLRKKAESLWDSRRATLEHG
jgi:hypothetical protein